MQTQVCLYNTQTHKISTTQSASIQYMEPTPGAQPTLEALHHSMQEVNRELLQGVDLVYAQNMLVWCSCDRKGPRISLRSV